jgi:predicted SprT family Zn-dependent metalloprotease
MANLQNSYLVDDFSECDGCGNLFHNNQIVASIQEPYYVCKNCENDLKKEMENKNE